ncbi:MAG: CHAT domain-containing protein [Pseudomonadota bacterium]
MPSQRDHSPKASRRGPSGKNRQVRSVTPITFVVQGSLAAPSTDAARRGGVAGGMGAKPALPAGLLRGQVKQAVRLRALRAGGAGGALRVQALPGRDVVVLHLAGGPSLVLHPENARDLMRAQQAGNRRSAGPVDDEEVAVPAELRWHGLEAAGAASRGSGTRGLLGSVLLAGIEIVTDAGGDSLADMAAEKVAERVDAQVEPGVYALQAQALAPLKGAGVKPLASLPAADGPLLVFVHGTFSNTAHAFGKLWSQHPQRVAALFRHYAERIYALEHATLGVSPTANALALAKTLPQGARLHLLTHSRGGLVAEVLARAAANPGLAGEDLRAFSAIERRELSELSTELVRKQVRIERVVRVACPARGTLLASKRLDAYLSVFKWTLELAGVPVLPELLDFLAAVAQRRADPDKLPGLAAQVPGSALIQWLHAADEPLPGDLRVIAGDVQGDSVGSWLKTLLADGFYWTDNDFVVQTRSMYGGAARAGGALFLLDRGARSSHSSYFANERSAEGACNALMHDRPEGFALIGPLSWSGESSTGVRAARGGSGDAVDMPASDKPAVILLPGILGSNLAVNGKRLWLGFRIIGGLKRLAYPDAAGSRVTPDGAIGPIYDDLAEHLAASHELIEFAFDWRQPLEAEARRLARVVEAALDARSQSGQPVRFVAHSMGGVVVRTLQLEAPELWDRLMAHPGARVLMLGTPNGGSWAPMQVLSGDDSFGNTLVAFGAPFQDQAARALMAQMPGFLQLQAALTDSAQQLDREATWRDLAARDLAAVRDHNWWHSEAIQLAAYEWGVPTQAVLDQALALRQRLDRQRDQTLPRFADKMLLVVGRARFTPDGFEIGNEGLVYLDASDAGDGRVTRASACLPGVRTWEVDCEHGALPDHEASFAAYTELLLSGSTGLLTRLPEAVGDARSAALRPLRHVRSRPSRQPQGLRLPELQSELGALAPHEAERAVPDSGMPALAVSVVNGNLMFMRLPLLVGHYRSTELTGSEAAVDNLIGGGMTSSLGTGVYPDGPGSFQMFRNTRGSDNPLQLPRPQWAIVVGLGDESELTPATLVHSARQAIIGWAQRIVESGPGAAQSFELCSTLIASGGMRITPGQSAQLIAQAAREANLRLRASGWPLLSQLVLVELYLDRASEAWRALQVLAARRAQDWRMAEHVRAGAGALRRPLDAGYRGTDYDLISATSVEGRGFDAVIAYTLDTRRARTEVRAQATQARLVRELVKRASNDRNQDPQIGRTLYQLLVPVEMDPFFGGTTEMRVELDSSTAGIPWELLHNAGSDSSDALPWAIRTKLLRKLRTTRFRQTVTDASADSDALVIGEPAVSEPERYPRLPGARREAAAVARRLASPGGFGSDEVRTLIAGDDPATAPDAHQVINALLEREWRIVHIAGHGEAPVRLAASDGGAARDSDPRGVVLSHGCFLGPREIRTMRAVPELVFINCCFLAERHPDQVLRSEPLEGYDRALFASSVAEELIRAGVRCVVAAGWAVEDLPAETFASSFYEALLAGDRFIDAAARARQAAWDVRGQGNTWAAYQCYGDPDWTLRRTGARQTSTPPAEKYAGISSPLGLAIALESVAIETRFLRADEREHRLAAQAERLTYLESRFGPVWGGMGAVAEAFAVAHSEVGDTERAIAWYERAVAANDASASQKSAEQLCNLRARHAESGVRRAWLALEAARHAAKSGPPRDTRELERAALALKRAAAHARRPLRQALTMIEQLLAQQPTIDRESIAGSACKHLSLVESATGHAARALAAVKRMKAHYARAEALARATDTSELFYPALSRMAAELVTDAAQPGWRGFDPADTAFLRQRLAEKTRDDPDFWSVAGLTELWVYEAVAARALAPVQSAITDEYSELHRRISGTNYWRPLYDTTHFALDGYAARANATERRACNQLVRLLEGFAWPPPSR